MLTCMDCDFYNICACTSTGANAICSEFKPNFKLEPPKFDNDLDFTPDTTKTCYITYLTQYQINLLDKGIDPKLVIPELNYI